MNITREWLDDQLRMVLGAFWREAPAEPHWGKTLDIWQCALGDLRQDDVERAFVAAAAGPRGLLGVTPDRVRALALREQVPPSMSDIIDAVAAESGVPVEEIRGPSRKRAISQARQVAMFLGRELAGKSSSVIGRAVGRSDHTTTLHGQRRIELAVDHDADVAALVAGVRARLGDGRLSK